MDEKISSLAIVTDIAIEDSIEKRLEYEKSLIKKSRDNYYKRKKKKPGFYQHEREHGWVQLMCPTCYHLEPAQIFNHLDITVANDIECNVDMHYMVKCPQCGHHHKNIVLDYNIAKPIQILNRKGFKTEFCCEGHGRFEPYVTFKFSFIMFYVDMLPLTWTFELYNGGIPRIYSGKKGWENAVYELTLFAESLPTFNI